MIDNTTDNEIDVKTESYEILCIYYFKNDDMSENIETDQDKLKDKDGYIIVGGNCKKIQVYKFKTGEYFCTMEGHQDSVTCFA